MVESNIGEEKKVQFGNMIFVEIKEPERMVTDTLEMVKEIDKVFIYTSQY